MSFPLYITSSVIESLRYGPVALNTRVWQAGKTTPVQQIACECHALYKYIKQVKRYIALFKETHLIHRLPPWSGNLGKRIAKTPKTFFTDNGLIAHLLGVDLSSIQYRSIQTGPLLENFILAELRKQTGWNRCKPNFFHFRSKTGQQVHFILEDRSGKCVGIEVKAASTVRREDFNGLRWLEKEIGKSFLRGIVLYVGEGSIAFGDTLYALPVSNLWRISS